MVSVEFTLNSLKNYVEPVAFFTFAAFAGSTRLIQYFPGATSFGLLLTTGIAGVASYIHNYRHAKYNNGETPSLLRRLIVVEVATIFAGGVTTLLKGRVSLVWNLQMIGLSAIVIAFKTLFEAVTSLSQKKPDDIPRPFQKPPIKKLSSSGEIIHSCFTENKLSLYNYPAAIQALKKLENRAFFMGKSHERARECFSAALAFFDLSVDFVSAQGWEYIEEPEQLDTSIFHWSTTTGVENDIPTAAEDTQRVHLFSVASQYNGAEATRPVTPPIGRAMEESEFDSTQGPLAQRTNPVIFELVTAFLANLGFNMMEYALPSAGKTFAPKSLIEHGYLRPTNETIVQLANEMESNFAKIEVPCYESRFENKSVFLILGAAPALGSVLPKFLDTNSIACKKLQHYAHLANFSAQFNQVKTLLERYPDKHIVLHVTGTGLGAFGCDPAVFAEAFAKVAYTFQASLSPEDRARVHVQLEAYQDYQGKIDPNMQIVINELKLGAAQPRL